MEMFLLRESETIPVSMARFANVAFSDGSLPMVSISVLQNANHSPPEDVRRYFITSQERSYVSCPLTSGK